MAKEHIEKLKSVVRGKTAIFIDAANLELSVKSMFVHLRDIPDNMKGKNQKELRWRVDYQKLKKFFSTLSAESNITFYTARFGSDSHEKFLTFLKRAGYSLVTKPLKQYQDHTPEEPHRKANFDVEISVDAVDSKAVFDTCILFSGDSDFEYLLRYLRGRGKRCIVFSRSGHISTELVGAASQYFDIVDFRFELLSIEPLKAKNPAPKGARSRS